MSARTRCASSSSSGSARRLLPLLNEKVMCGLGRGIARTGRLNRDGVELAYANLQRFVALARALQRRSPRGHRHRGGARGRATAPPSPPRSSGECGVAGADHRRAPRRRGCRRSACSPASRRRTASSAISAAAASSWCEIDGGSGRPTIGAGVTPAARAAAARPSSATTARPIGRDDRARSSPSAPVLREAAGKTLLSGRRRLARDRPAAHGAGALSAAHHPPIHDRAAPGRRLPRHRRRPVAALARADHRRSTASGSKSCRWRR